jgi:DNA primase
VDESAEQTQRIHRMQRERRTLAGLIAREQRKDVLKKLRNAQRLLQSLAILNPFAPALTFATARTRNRRDHEKYLTLIDAIALLHQHQREIKTLSGEQRYIEVTLDDIALANQLAPEVLGRSLDELPPQTRRALAYIRDVMKSKRKGGSATGHQGAKTVTTFSRKELRDACGWSLTQVRVHLERLVDLEYLAVRHGRIGSQFVYETLFDLDTPETVAHVGLIDVEQLRRNLAGFGNGVAGQNGHLTEGDEMPPSPVSRNGHAALLHT